MLHRESQEIQTEVGFTTNCMALKNKNHHNAARTSKSS
jgi:hypothetical protein